MGLLRCDTVKLLLADSLAPEPAAVADIDLYLKDGGWPVADSERRGIGIVADVKERLLCRLDMKLCGPRRFCSRLWSGSTNVSAHTKCTHTMLGCSAQSTIVYTPAWSRLKYSPR